VTRAKHGFRIVRAPGLFYQLFDTDTFNPWPTISRFHFRTRPAADDFAWNCYYFKTGQTWNCPDPPPADLVSESANV